jgi:Family of unknown function (DUF6178)
MKNNEIQKDLLSQLLYESQSYRKFEDIEKLVDQGKDLSMIPIQPLYVSLQSTSKDQLAQILPKLSSEQRQALRDIDLWQKDVLDPQATYYWMEVYSKVPDDEVILEYVKSEDFLLSLKNQFDVATFDVEDPMYPDDDNYFLTEDNQLIIEYPADFNMVTELKEFIRRLYGDMGVEYAYAFLFKMVVDSYQIMEEQVYQEKVERLRDFGFVDYYEAINYDSSFSSEHQISEFIKNKKSLTGQLDATSANQGLHSSSLTPYQAGLDLLKDSLDKVESEKRQQYLHFNFIRLVNARMTLQNALKHGSVAMGRVGHETRQCLELGFEFVQDRRVFESEKSLFDVFDFMDVYKVGHSLISLAKKKIKKALSTTPFEADEFDYFLGMYWNAFLENSLDEVTKYKFDGSSKPAEIKDLAIYGQWMKAIDTFCEAMPFVLTFFATVQKMKAEGLLNDQFYLNYEVDNIDFEAIMISSFINYSAGHYEEASAGKMGVTVSELKKFYGTHFVKQGEEYLIKGSNDQALAQKIEGFVEKFGLNLVPHFSTFLHQIMVEQLNGYEVDGMTEEDFKHIGGPILLNNVQN